MRNDFEIWLSDIENKVSGTVANYTSAIDKISIHYSSETGNTIDIYQIKDINLLKNICKEYCRGGKFEDFGDYEHGRYRAAILAYIRYFEETESGDVNVFDEETKFSISDSKISVKKDSTGRISMCINLLVEEE